MMYAFGVGLVAGIAAAAFGYAVYATIDAVLTWEQADL